MDSPASKKGTAKKHMTEAELDEHIANLSRYWQQQHDEQVRTIEADLLKSRTEASGPERLLVGLASHDAALASLLGKAETQLAYRIHATVGDMRVAIVLARVLKEVTKCRESAERRLCEVLQASAILRGQQKLVERSHLRRVA
jgi:hypothetical protein